MTHWLIDFDYFHNNFNAGVRDSEKKQNKWLGIGGERGIDPG